MNENMLKSCMMNASHELDSMLLPPHYGINDINLETLSRYRTYIKDGKHLSDEELLVSIGALKRDADDKLLLTKGGLLFFGKYLSIRNQYPHFHLDYFEIWGNAGIRWDERISTGDIDFPEMNVFDFYILVYERSKISISDRFLLNRDTMQRVPFRMELRDAFREALVNCLMHAHYDIDIPIKITHYGNRIEFFNPGMPKIPLEEFFVGGLSRAVNETMAALFRRAGISERAGTGGRRIYEVAKYLQLKDPTLETTYEGCTKLIIWKIALFSDIKDSRDELRLVEYLLENSPANIENISEALSLTKSETRLALEHLEQTAYILKGGYPGFPVYSIHADSEALRQSMTEQVQRLLLYTK